MAEPEVAMDGRHCACLFHYEEEFSSKPAKWIELCGYHSARKREADAMLNLLRYFVAFHTPGEMPKEFQGGQLQQRLADARSLIDGSK